MNTPTQPRAPRVSEGTASARALLDDTRRGQMPQPYLLTPVSGSVPVQGNTARRPPLRLIKTRERASMCGFGVCALSPECTNQCRYREADEALRGHYSGRHTQRQTMPVLPVQDHSSDPDDVADQRARRLVAIGILAWFAILIAASAWAVFR